MRKANRIHEFFCSRCGETTRGPYRPRDPDRKVYCPRCRRLAELERRHRRRRATSEPAVSVRIVDPPPRKTLVSPAELHLTRQKVLAETDVRLCDDFRPLPAKVPTNRMPGSDRVAILAARYAAGQELFHPEDLNAHDSVRLSFS
jgi:CxxC-x17-CxxC domain-containing protein